MDITQIRHFVRVAETGSYIKAADLLNVAQSTLSRQVRALEVELRASLFYRHGRGVLPTEAGKKFLEYARATLHTIDSAVIAVRDSEASYSGQLVLGMPNSVGRICLSTVVPRLMERFPRASISVIESMSSALYQGVLLGHIDFAFVHNPTASPNIRILPVASDELYLIGPRPAGPDPDRVRLAELAHVPLILPHGNHAVRVAVETAAARQGVTANIALQVDAFYPSIELVAKGLGYSIMPGMLEKAARLPSLSWQKITDPVLENATCMVLPSQPARNPLHADAAELVRSTLIEILAR
ncbi:LysR family transcriptional regulator [Pigmentiphaga sp. CHJ604]|uniref:LysR family transcriptional regulator n=1 Tax=Pigmentiphaga sp. CHJ604 TaxID=3081984 RepID=UPI0030CF1817